MPSYMDLEVKEIPPNYKAKLKDRDVKDYGEKSSEAFENIVTWCLNGEVEKLEKANKKDLYMKLLRSRGTRPCVDNLTEYTICEFASVSGNVEVMKILPKNYIGRSLIFATLKDDLEMVQYILSDKAHYQTEGVKRCICPAIQRSSFNIVKALVENRKNWEESKAKSNSNDNETLKRYIDYGGAMYFSVKKERLDLVKLLIDNHADPTSAIVSAVQKPNFEIVEFLVENGACLFQIYENSSLIESMKGWGCHRNEKVMDFLTMKMKTKRQSVPLNHIARTSSYLQDDFTKLVTHCLSGNISEINGKSAFIFDFITEQVFPDAFPKINLPN